jgi:hypothetical protein
VENVDVDRLPVRRERNLVEMPQPLEIDHERGSSTSKSTSIP